MNKSLQKAIDCLRIQDVYLRSSVSTIVEEFEPKYETDFDDLNVRFKHLVTQSSVLHLDVDNETPQQLFRVFVELGVLWTDSEHETSDNSEPEDFKAKIEAVMVAEYQMEEDPGPEALKEFALHNASFHIWPYWREYLATQTMRMHIPKMVMPTVQFAARSE